MKWLINWILSVFKLSEEHITPVKWSRLSEEEVNTIIDLYNSKWDVESISIVTGRCKSTIYRHIKELKNEGDSV